MYIRSIAHFSLNHKKKQKNTSKQKSPRDQQLFTIVFPIYILTEEQNILR